MPSSAVLHLDIYLWKKVYKSKRHSSGQSARDERPWLSVSNTGKSDIAAFGHREVAAGDLQIAI